MQSKKFSSCLKIFPCATTKFRMFSLSGKSKDQIPCFPCAVATLFEAKNYAEQSKAKNYKNMLLR